MQGQLVLQAILRKKISEIRGSNPTFSIRAFARRLNMNSGALSALMSGKRNASAKLARRIAEGLALDPQERMELLSLFPDKHAASSQDIPDPTYLQLSAAQYRVIGEWEHFAILTLMRAKGFSSNASWIADRLGVTPTKVERAIGRLISIGIVHRAPNGDLKRIPQKFRTTDDVIDMSVQRSHEETLELAKSSLHQHAIGARDFTHISLAVDPAKMEEAKELIRKFQDDFAKVVETGNNTEVYRLSIQYFPLTKIERES